MELLPHVNLAELVPLVEILDGIEKKFGADMKIAAGVQGSYRCQAEEGGAKEAK